MPHGKCARRRLWYGQEHNPGDEGLWSDGHCWVHDGGMSRRVPPGSQAKCPIRPGEPCTLCQLDVTGPQDCPLVYLVMADDELREGLHRNRLARTRQHSG